MSERREIDELVAGYEELTKRTEELQAKTEIVKAQAERLNEEAVVKIEELSADNDRLRGDLDAWENKEPLSPDPERVQLRYLVKENERLRAERERLRGEMSTMHRSVVHKCCVDVEDLRAAMKQAVEELDAEHWPEWYNNEAERAGKEPVGCGVCWPKFGSWPCTGRMIADDLRAALGEES